VKPFVHTLATSSAILALCLGVPGPAPAAEDAQIDETVRKGLSYLLSKQQSSGAIQTQDRNSSAMSALAVMALASSGHQPADGSPEGAAMKRALEFVLHPDRQTDEGYFGRDGSRMYGHGIITLMLAEMLGMGANAEQDQNIRDALRPAVDVILKAQQLKTAHNPDHFGGWRYEPNASDSDLSVTIWQLLALRAAGNAGLEIPTAAIGRAVGYVKRCYRPQRKNDLEQGACAYMPNQGPSYAAAAAGLLALQVCGAYDADEVQASTRWLRSQRLDYNGRFFFYGTYYYAQGLYRRGGEDAAFAWDQYMPILLERQSADGSWPCNDSEREAGEVYTTSMAILSLCVRHHFLPIYQR